MDKLADQFPEINDLTKFANFSAIIQYVLNKVIEGELVKPSQNTKDDLTEKIKQQTHLKLCLQNWQSLKANGTIFEDAKAIITMQKELETPTMMPLLDKQPTKMLIHDYFCEDCKHYHARSEPHVCTLLTCNCGVRG